MQILLPNRPLLKTAHVTTNLTIHTSITNNMSTNSYIGHLSCPKASTTPSSTWLIITPLEWPTKVQSLTRGPIKKSRATSSRSNLDHWRERPSIAESIETWLRKSTAKKRRNRSTRLCIRKWVAHRKRKTGLVAWQIPSLSSTCAQRRNEKLISLEETSMSNYRQYRREARLMRNLYPLMSKKRNAWIPRLTLAHL